jgi:S1-C subfamily serine protease
MSMREISEGVAKVAEEVGPAVVGIGAWGSGVVVAPGQVLTNAHNLRGDETVVTFGDGRRVAASVLGADRECDLALLGVDTGDVAPVGWAERAPRAGELVVALAHPGGRSLRVSLGVVSALGVSFRGPGGLKVTGALEHTAPLARGASGGPVLDAEGHLVGLDTHRQDDGFYLAVVADADLRARLDGLTRGEVPERRRLGVALAPSGVARRLRRSVGLPERDGLLVRGVEPGGPAERSGIRQGDLLVSAGGQSVTSPDDLQRALQGLGTEDALEVGLVRGTEELTVAVTFGPGGASNEGSA